MSSSGNETQTHMETFSSLLAVGMCVLCTGMICNKLDSPEFGI